MQLKNAKSIKDAIAFLDSDEFKCQPNKSVKITFTKPIKTAVRGRSIKVFEFQDYVESAGYCRIFWRLKDGTLSEYSRKIKPCQKEDVDSGVVNMTVAPKEYFELGAAALINRLQKKFYRKGVLSLRSGLPFNFTDIS